MRRTKAGEEERDCNRASRDFSTGFEESALEQLKEAGLRITMPRIQVIRALSKSNRSMTAYEIHAGICEDGGRIDVVSVYRILQTLLNIGMVHRIGIVDGYYACREPHAIEHDAEHLVCSECGCVTELSVAGNMVEGLSTQAKGAGFRPSEIRVEMLGLCEHCQSSGPG